MYKSALNASVNRRNTTDRRIHEQKWRHDRRVRPDRRLNSISVEWIPFSEVISHPTIREALRYRKNRNQAKGTTKIKKPASVCIFDNQWSPIVNRRNTTDRRTRQEKLPFDRRTKPDRRLNNISVEWIPY
jgi:hypothetical protein